jgi:hypothetical protein
VGSCPGDRLRSRPIFLFRLSSFELALVICGVVVGATALGVFLGRRVRHLSDDLKEPFGVLQGALLGVVGLILAFGLSLAVSRYENRRASMVDEANTIGTTYLRAQTLPEPIRTRSLSLLVAYTRRAIEVSNTVPGSSAQDAAAEGEQQLQRQLWALGGHALETAPVASAPRLYIETLNEMIDAQSVRIAALNNQVPNAVFILEVLGAALALGLLAAYLAISGRGFVAAALASLLVSFLLLVIADLDRPTRGMIRVPDTPLRNQLASMELPPAADAPGRR